VDFKGDGGGFKWGYYGVHNQVTVIEYSRIRESNVVGASYGCGSDRIRHMVFVV